MTTVYSFTQECILTGSLLGDGHLSKPRGNSNSYFSKCQCEAHIDYLKWTFEQLGNFSSSISVYDNHCKGKAYKKAVYLTKALPQFTELRKKWYPDGKKIVPSDLKLSPLSIAMWFFDDGSNVVEYRGSKFSTNCFTRDECSFLSNLLANYDIQCTVSKRNELLVRCASYKTLIDLVKPYMLWPCFEHKVQYREPELEFTTDEEGREMFRLHAAGHPYRDIVEKVGKSISVVSAVLRGERLAHLGLAKAVPGLSLKNTSGHKGVSWDRVRGKWVGTMKRAGKTVNLGRFATVEEAVMARTNAQSTSLSVAEVVH
jgi:hypothetical protein